MRLAEDFKTTKRENHDVILSPYVIIGLPVWSDKTDVGKRFIVSEFVY